MYIEVVRNRNSPPCTLLRESYREGTVVRKKTLANLTSWPKRILEDFKQLLKGKKTIDKSDDGFKITKSLPYGHVAAIIGTIKNIGLDKLISPRRSRERDLILGMIVSRIINPASKAATAREYQQETAFSAVGHVFDIADSNEDELYAAMDWLYKRQYRIEKRLAKKHLKDGFLVLYDVSSSYFEGQRCPLAQRGYDRDKKKGKKIVVYGLMCDKEGRPVSIEVFKGNVKDPKTFAKQIPKVLKRFKLKNIVFVGDRGMITQKNIKNDLSKIEGIEWITALRGNQIQKLLRNGRFKPEDYEKQKIGEITAPEYPKERLIVCRNPLLAQERHRERNELIAATEKELKKIKQSVDRPKKPLRGKIKIALRVGEKINKFKVRKHFDIKIEKDSFRDRIKITFTNP